MKLDDCIAFLAEYGCSKHQVAKVLDIPMETFLDICKSMPGVEWKQKGKTLGDLRALKKRQYSARRRRETLSAPMELNLDERVTMFGETGTVREIIAKFASVSHKSVVHRIKLGYSLQEAILKPTNRGPARRAGEAP